TRSCSSPRSRRSRRNPSRGSKETYRTCAPCPWGAPFTRAVRSPSRSVTKSSRSTCRTATISSSPVGSTRRSSVMIAAYGLSKFFPIRGAFRSTTSLKAVDDVGLKIQNEQVVGLVGESGSGKSTVGRCLIRLLKPTEGEILFDIPDSELVEYRYPHQLSGGQRQRVAIARAISTNPKLLILDEPTSALDVSVQAQILNLLRGLQEKYGISMLLITHNIAVVAYLAEYVYVMYAGKIMEWGEKGKVLRDPQHPYTKALMSSVPVIGETMTRTILRGDPPNLVSPPIACRFHPRCPVAFEVWASSEVPSLPTRRLSSHRKCLKGSDGEARVTR